MWRQQRREASTATSITSAAVAASAGGNRFARSWQHSGGSNSFSVVARVHCKNNQVRASRQQNDRLHIVSFITCLFHNSVSEFSFHEILSVSVLCQFSTLVGVPHLSVSSLVCCYLCRFHTAAAAATAVAADKCFNYERSFGFKSIVLVQVIVRWSPASRHA